MEELGFQKIPISTDTSNGRQLGAMIWSRGSKEPPCGLARPTNNTEMRMTVPIKSNGFSYFVVICVWQVIIGFLMKGMTTGIDGLRRLSMNHEIDRVNTNTD